MDIKDKASRISQALEQLSCQEQDCRICPRECGVNRLQGEKGFCASGPQVSISHALLHFGEEPVLSGAETTLHHQPKSLRKSQPNGSGTIFFSGCHLKCCFCQNYQISWLHQGHTLKTEELAGMMIHLQEKGALNINLVSPSHFTIAILKALRRAYSIGLNIPLVFNSNGYEKVETLRHWEGIIDIFLPDLKFRSPSLAKKLCGVSDYFARAGPALREMNRQQPELILNQDDIASQGLILRHLVLPGQSQDSLKVLEWAAENLSPTIGLSLMSQYYPCFQAPANMQRSISSKEYHRVLDFAQILEIENLFIQPEPFSEGENLIPDFTREEPFKWK